MSFWSGIKSWFTRRKNQPYALLIEELNKINRDILSLLVIINTKEGRYNLRKLLEKANSHINEFKVRFSKINNNEELKTLILVRNPTDAQKFLNKANALITLFPRIYEKIRGGKINEKDKNDLKDKLLALETDLETLKELAESIEKSLEPRKFKKSKAIDPHGATGSTVDGKSISKIIKATRGLGFETKTGKKHTWLLVLEDGQPCAIGSHSTSFDIHVRDRLARASGRTSQEIEALIQSI